MKVSIICVNYNSYEQLRKYLASLQFSFEKSRGILLEVFCADNSSIKQQVKFDLPFRFEIMQFDNLGYFGGALAIINSRKTVKESDYVIISNVDLQVEEDFFKNLSSTKIDNRVAWLAPKIWSNYEQRDKNPQRYIRPSKKKLNQLIFLYSHPFFYYLYERTLYRRKKNKSACPDDMEIYCGHGSFIILTKFFVEKYERIEYPCFLYCEELFLGELIRKADMKVLYKPRIKIIDDEHVSTAMLPSKKYYEYNLNSLRFIKKSFY